MLSKKDIIVINQEFNTGKLMNEGSLDFAIGMTKKSKNWLKSTAILTRAILIDHVFEDGNKRTTAAVILTYLDMNNFNYNEDKLGQIIITMLKKNITDIRKIERLIKNVSE